MTISSHQGHWFSGEEQRRLLSDCRCPVSALFFDIGMVNGPDADAVGGIVLRTLLLYLVGMANIHTPNWRESSRSIAVPSSGWVKMMPESLCESSPVINSLAYRTILTAAEPHFAYLTICPSVSQPARLLLLLLLLANKSVSVSVAITWVDIIWLQRVYRAEPQSNGRGLALLSSDQFTHNSALVLYWP